MFHKSTTSLRLWFWAIYLLSSTRFQISYRELERELGVSYRTAQRMFERISDALEGVQLGPEPAAVVEPPPQPSAFSARPAWQGRRRRS
jgi:hypothetical protein